MIDLPGIGILLALFVVFLLVVQFGHRWLNTRPETTRALIHILGGIFMALLPSVLSRESIVVLGVLFAFLLLLTKHLNLVYSIHGVERVTYGEIFFPLGVAVTAYLFLPGDLAAFQFGVLVLGVSDAIASLVGRNFGSYKISFLKSTKTIEGSLGFLLTTMALLFMLNPATPFLWLFAIPLVLTILEFALIYGFDDLLLPILAGILFQLVP